MRAPILLLLFVFSIFITPHYGGLDRTSDSNGKYIEVGFGKIKIKPILEDLDQDGIDELLIADKNLLYIMKYSQEKNEYYIWHSIYINPKIIPIITNPHLVTAKEYIEIISSPLVGDFDGDGDLEISVITNRTIIFLDSNMNIEREYPHKKQITDTTINTMYQGALGSISLILITNNTGENTWAASYYGGITPWRITDIRNAIGASTLYGLGEGIILYNKTTVIAIIENKTYSIVEPSIRSVYWANLTSNSSVDLIIVGEDYWKIVDIYGTELGSGQLKNGVIDVMIGDTNGDDYDDIVLVDPGGYWKISFLGGDPSNISAEYTSFSIPIMDCAFGEINNNQVIIGINQDRLVIYDINDGRLRVNSSISEDLGIPQYVLLGKIKNESVLVIVTDKVVAGVVGAVSGEWLGRNAYKYGTSHYSIKRDIDGDGIPDSEDDYMYDSDLDDDLACDGVELLLGTNITARDTDGDGLIDGFELGGGLNPRSVDSDGDSILDSLEDNDLDNLKNWEEQNYFSSPILYDTDWDGLTDYEEIGTNTSPINCDTDLDMLPDIYEVTWGLDPIHANGSNDSDSDYLTDCGEYIYGTNPLNRDTDGDSLLDGWEIYYGFDPIRKNESSADPDKDNLTNYKEMIYGTNPWSNDTDSDGLPDSWEIKYGLDPLTPNRDGDPDGDGLTNIEEYELGTNPTNSDTDGDGFSDGVEVEEHTDPLDPNSHPEASPQEPEGNDILFYIVLALIAGSIVVTLLIWVLHIKNRHTSEI